MFRVRVNNEDLILGYGSGRICRNFIQILPFYTDTTGR
uniref:Translation initiation factor 1 n=1 Tax=Aquilegia rockii TaxID=1291456 RepID=A0A6G6DAG6_9MAGN|nr:translation initiation factor 1 [Aquilegia rockii]QIE13480.1 translation initiation factor 1 [Aquilegia rockii]